MFFSLRQLALLLMFCVFVASSTAVFAGDDWREVTPAERQMTTGKVEGDTDAEAIFWEVRVDDSTENLVMKHYLRIKIFNERGREKYSKVDIPFVKGGIKIKNIMARVIKPDGTIIPLAKTDIFEREIIRKDKIKVKAKSFAVPNIEAGVILEYRYDEVYPYGSANDMRMTFQHDIPIENISYYFKPALDAKYLTFNMGAEKFVKDKGGFYRATLENVPAIKEEAYMPPEDEVRSWLVLYYTSDLKGDYSDFWSRAGGYIARVFDIKDTLKPGKDLKTAATTIVEGATAPDDQMAKIYEFCKTKVKNVSYDPSLTEEQKDDIKPSKSASDTYKKLQGRSADVNELFASLATSLGYETRLAFGGDRSEKFFNPRQAHESFIHFSAVAVKINGQWKYYDPGDQFAPLGVLPWNEEDTSVLLLGYKDYVTTKTPFTPMDRSAANRTGRFKLLEDGTLEGTVKVQLTGQQSYEMKHDLYDDSIGKREEDMKKTLTDKMSTAEVSDIVFENITDPEKPVSYQYKIKVPNYAQKAGKRIFFQPGFFEYGATPVFAGASRKYDIFFHYPWSENDDIEIALPAGYALDNADMPGSFTDGQKIASLSINIGVDPTGSVMKYNRKFFFGGGGNTLFPAASYEPVKALFDVFNKSDTHSIALRQK
jgi:Domain of Unknown Function with PDB structure (DUF3857)/Transglutaminase-like superfamily